MIWLIGGTGLLGSEISTCLEARGIPFVSTGRELDIGSFREASRFSRGMRFDWIMNCAAYTNVDEAEDVSQRESCRRINAVGAGNIAVVARILGAKLLYISTDYIFDGRSPIPYVEDDPVSPLSVYGSSKAEGEDRVRDECPEHVILRTSWLFGKRKPNFISTMLRLMSERTRIGVVSDQRACPTSAVDLARAIVGILRTPAPVFGTFHCTGSGEASRYELAIEAQRLGAEYGLPVGGCLIEPIASADFPTRARRPAYSVMRCDKIRDSYGIELPPWPLSLRSYVEGLAL